MPTQVGCRTCGFDWGESTGELISRLRDRGEAIPITLSTVAAPADRRRPAPDVWSAHEYLGHIGDVVEWYHDRVERVLREDRPVLAGLDWSTETDKRNYHQQSASKLTAHAQSVVLELANRLAGLTHSEWQRVGIGSDGPERTVVILARRAAHEVHHHLGDITSRH